MFKKLKEFRKNANEKYDARFASANLVTKRFLILAMTFMICFSVFDIVSTKVLAGGQGKNQDVIAVNMYGLSQSVATGTWQLGVASKKYEGASGYETSPYFIKDASKAYDLGTYETGRVTYSSSPQRQPDGSYRPSVIPATAPYDPSDSWGIAANLIGMYNNLAFGDLGDAANAPGTNQAVNEHSWDLDTVMSMYSLGNKSNETTQALIQYWSFGKALTDVGILEYQTAAGENTSSLRPILGYGTYISYMICTTSSTIIKQCLDLAASLDIIGIFEGDYASSTNSFITTITGSMFFAEMQTFYNSVKSLSWAIFVVFLLIFIFQLTIFRPLSSFTAAQTIRDNTVKLIMRALIMFAGVPTLMMVYHICLSIAITGGTSVRLGNPGSGVYDDDKYYATQTINDTMLSRDGGANQKDNFSDSVIESYVMSTFVDMDYVIRSNFALSSKASDVVIEYEYDREANKFMLMSDNKLGTLAYNLNGYTGVAPLEKTIFGNNNTGIKGIKNYDIYGVYAGEFTQNNANPGNAASSAGTTHDFIRSLLIDYADGAVIESTNVSQAINIYNGDVSKFVQNILRTNSASVEEAEGYFSSFVQSINHDLTLWMSMSPSYKDATLSPIAGKDGPNGVYYLTGSDTHVIYAYSGIDFGVGTKSSNLKLYSDMVHLQNGGGVGMPISISNVIFGGDAGGPVTRANLFKTPTAVAGGGGVGDVVGGVVAPALPNNAQATKSNPKIKITFNSDGANFSPLGYYNFLHTRFTDDGFIVCDPTKTANNATGMSIYKVSAVHSDLREIIQIVYLNAVLLSFGLIGWVFGVSTLANIIVEFFQMIPSLLKSFVGSTKAFAHACAVMLTIVFEIIATLALYTLSIKFIDFVVRLVGGLMSTVGSNLTTVAGKDIMEMLACLIISAVLLWSCSLLIKFRKAIVLWFTGVIKAAMSMMFKAMGYNVDIFDSDVGNANNNKLALAGAGVMAAGALASSGDLNDIASDLSGSKLGQQIMDNFDDDASDNKTGLDLAETAIQRAAMGDFKGAGMSIMSRATDGTVLEGLGNKGANALFTNQEADAAMEGAEDSIDGGNPSGIENNPTDQSYAQATSQPASVDQSGQPAQPTQPGQPAQNGVTSDQADQASTDATEIDSATPTSEAGTMDAIASEVGYESENATARTTGYEASNSISTQAAQGDARAFVGEGGVKEANNLDGLGLTQEQHSDVQTAIESGASNDEVREMISAYQSDNFGSVANANAFVSARNDGVVAETFTTSSGGSVAISAGNQTYDTSSNMMVDQGRSNYSSGGESVMTFASTGPGASAPVTETYHTSEYGGGVEAARATMYTNTPSFDFGYNADSTATQQAYMNQTNMFANNPTADTWNTSTTMISSDTGSQPMQPVSQGGYSDTPVSGGGYSDTSFASGDYYSQYDDSES